MNLKSKKIGLALGGGAALGAAHIGVLKALEEFEIQPSYISGTSVGAIIAAFHAFGKGWEEIRSFAHDLNWMDFTGITLSKYGLLSNHKMEDLLESKIGDSTFAQADLPLAIVATDISTGEKVVLKEGDVGKAVIASTCIPGVFIPVSIGDQLLVDGGIVENVPFSPLQQMGADMIIGVDLNAKHVYKKPNNIIEVLMNSFHFTLKAATKAHYNAADILIQPDLSNFSRTDTDQTEGLLEAGYQATVSVLKDLSL